MPKIKENIAKLFSRDTTPPPEISLGSAAAAVAELPRPSGTPVDLTGKPKVWFVFGPGGTGKSTLLTWQANRAAQHDGIDNLILATTDLGRGSLQLRFPDNTEVISTQRRLEQLLSYVMENRQSAAIDFAADATVQPVLERIPNLAQTMSDAGVEPVVFYMLGTRQLDLTVLRDTEAAGFQPAATCLVLNMARMDIQRDARGRITTNPEEEFAQIRNHSVYRKARERGAIEAWMPRLEEARLLEDRRIGFWDAANNAGGSALDDIQRHAVSAWIGRMERVSEPWKSWHLP